jgi:hypothetical protein
MKINDTGRIRTQINGVRQSMANVRQNVHAALCQVVGHALLHGASPLATLLLTNTKGANQGGIISWLELHGPFAVDRQAGDANFAKGKRKTIEAENKIPSGDNTPERIKAVEKYVDGLNESAQWWETSTRAKKDAPDTLNVAADVIKFLDAFDKRVKKAKLDDVSVVDGELLRYLRQAVATYTADQAIIAAEMAARASQPQQMTPLDADGQPVEVKTEEPAEA